jgi:hypothetical protein
MVNLGYWLRAGLEVQLGVRVKSGFSEWKWDWVWIDGGGY